MPGQFSVKINTVQTGAKSRFGGRHDGLFKRSYHSPGRKKEPVIAARKEAAMKPSSGTQESASITTYSDWMANAGASLLGRKQSFGRLAVKMLFRSVSVGLGHMHRAVAMFGRSIKGI